MAGLTDDVRSVGPIRMDRKCSASEARGGLFSNCFLAVHI